MPLKSPQKEEEIEPQSVFQRIELDDIDSPYNSDSHESISREKKSSHELPATQKAVFREFDLDDYLLKNSEHDLSIEVGSSAPDLLFNSLLDTITIARCPMCNAAVDPQEIKKIGKTMNFKMQEKFCRAHRKKTAQEDWKTRGYPLINWSILDSRVSECHSLIKKLINGSDCYYRNLMEEKVIAGKDRSLQKMTSNLSPGYYGGRGLRIISENIMQRFTPLLKKRMVEDKLMSARGVTPYVQSVLVPEVTTRLIMDDMHVTEEEARTILMESVEIGELLNEEIGDVVKRNGDDSEDDEDGKDNSSGLYD